jgi:hypothetical protein
MAWICASGATWRKCADGISGITIAAATMTSERLNDLIEHCFRLHRMDNREAHYRNIARFLGVEPITLRRWITGASPVPRQVEIVMEIFHAWPEVRAEAVDKLIRERDGGSRG